MTRYLFENALATITPEGVFGNLDIVVENDTIVQIAPPGRIDYPGDGDSSEVIDATNCILMPGFVDTHRHTWQTAVRGILPSCTLDEYFAGVLGKLNGVYRPEDVAISNRMGALEAINAGITTLVDWSHISRTPEHAQAAIHGLAVSGIRAIYAHGAPGSPEYWAGSDLEHPEDIRRIAKQLQGNSQITLAMAGRAPGAVTDRVIRADAHTARELGIRTSVHVGYRLSGHHPNHIEDLFRLGALDHRMTCIHATDSSDAELDLLQFVGSNVSIAPYVEMLMGHGYPPTGKLRDRGVTTSISIDVASSVPGDMFTQMRTLLVAERIRQLPESSAIKFTPNFTHEHVFDMATLAGAKACGLDHLTGSLEVGKKADIVMLRTDCINTQPVIDPLGTVVVMADTSNIDTVVVNGVLRKQHGHLLLNGKVTPLSGLFAQLNASRDYLLNAAGMR